MTPARALFVLLTPLALGCGDREAPPPPTPVGAVIADGTAAPGQLAGAPAPAPRPGFMEMRIGTLQPSLQGGWALVLVDAGGRVQVPMLIGDPEADAIQRRMRGEAFSRPLTHDLLDAVVRRLGATVVMVEVDTVRGGAFVSNLVLWNGSELVRVDSRTSDAVAVAIGNRAPIYVSQQVIDQTGVPSL